MRIAILGPLEVRDRGAVVAIGGPRQRLVLAHLVLNAGRLVSADRLIGAVWGDELPESPKSAVQVAISRLRAAIPSVVIEGRPPGYVLRVDPDEIDALRFEALVSEARVGGLLPTTVVAKLTEGLDLWRGPALADLADEPSLAADIARLEELRLQAMEERIAAELDMGRHAEAVVELEMLTRTHPTREQLWSELMLTLYRSDRQADALAAFERARALLAEELGIDPSEELRELQGRILRQDPELRAPAHPTGGYRGRGAIGPSAPARVTAPPTRYATTADGIHIAYSVVGSGPDLVAVIGWVSNIEYMWEWPLLADFWHRLAAFSRLIMFDKRGTGLSDPVSIDRLPNLETRMDDVRAVMDAAGSDRATLFGISEGAAMSILFGASYPDRAASLVLYGGYACEIKDEDHPWGWLTREEKAFELEFIERAWGTNEYAEWALRTWGAPSHANDVRIQEAWATWMRRSASPASAVALERMNAEIDVTGVLPAVRVPTLILHREGDQPEFSRHMADRIPGSEYVELPGRDHIPFVGDVESIVDQVKRFVLADEREPDLDRVLATVLFVRIAESRQGGDGGWKAILDRRDDLQHLVGRYRGRDMRIEGAGIVATFDGPARAVHCARAILDLGAELRVELRAGVNVGEVPAGRGGEGVVLDVGAGMVATAGPGDVLVTRTVRDLVAGSGLAFEDLGERHLDGLPDPVRLFRLAGPTR